MIAEYRRHPVFMAVCAAIGACAGWGLPSWIIGLSSLGASALIVHVMRTSPAIPEARQLGK